MKLGYNEATCMNNSTLQKDLELCEKYGYEYIEIRLDMLEDYLKENTIADLKNFFDTHNLKPYGFNSIENINFCSAVEWEALLRLVKFACETSKVIGGKCLVVVPTMGTEMKNKSEQEIFEDSVKVLTELSDFVESYGIKLAFEPIGDARWCVRSVEQALKIIEKVNRENVGIALDSFNEFLYCKLEDIDSIDKIPLEKIFVYHIDDSDDIPLGILDHCHRLLPGNGIIPLNKLSEKLKNKGYDSICSVELFNPGYWAMNAEDVFRLAAEKTKKFL